MTYLDVATVQYALDDISIIPAVTSDIRSRKECNPFNENGMLPIFTAPMATIVSPNNFDEWQKNKITPILPRNIDIQTRLQYTRNNKWSAYSLTEFEEYFIKNIELTKPINNDPVYVLIDIANGHMQILIDYIRQSKEVFGENGYTLKIMVGNIAHPRTYQVLAEAGADFIRCSIGSGSNCTTSVHGKIHYGMASLISECFDIKEQNQYNTAIIADGGISNYGRAITALALGADYIMVGSAFAKCYESAAVKQFKHNLNTLYKDNEYLLDLYSFNHDMNIFKSENNEHIYTWLRADGTLLEINQHNDNIIKVPTEEQKRIILKMLNKGDWYAEHFGMSTKTAQKLIDSNAKLKTSEGMTSTINIEYTINGWVENFIDYLRSTMSYCGKRTLYDFSGNVALGILSPSEQFAFNK